MTMLGVRDCLFVLLVLTLVSMVFVAWRRK